MDWIDRDGCKQDIRGRLSIPIVIHGVIDYIVGTRRTTQLGCDVIEWTIRKRSAKADEGYDAFHVVRSDNGDIIFVEEYITTTLCN